jgi:hypothetical protein
MTSRAVSAIACFAGEYAATRRESRTFPEPDNEEREVRFAFQSPTGFMVAGIG